MTTASVPSDDDGADGSLEESGASAVPSQMQAFVQSRYGGPETLELGTIDVPEPDAGEVLVRVHAASANPADWHFMRGDPYVMRLASGLRRPSNPVRGFDLAGPVAAVGDGVDALAPGDEVFGSTYGGSGDNGAFAEYATVDVEKLAALPDSCTFQEAAGIPMVGTTALQGLRQGGVEAGSSVLINGASGGVGTIAVQIAAGRGAAVTGVCSTRNLDLVTGLGADHVVDYTEADFAALDRRYDCVFDLVGNRSLSALRRALAADGTLVASGGEGGRWLGPFPTLLRGVLTDRFVGQELTWLFAETTAADLEALAALLDDGTIEPVIDRTYPFEETPEAMTYLETGHARGKVVVDVLDERR